MNTTTRAMRSPATAIAAALCVFLTACGGGGASPGNSSGGTSTKTFTVGGTVSGLPSGAQLVLQNNGANPLTVAASGAFSFAVPLAAGSTYDVTAQTQPAWWNCAVSQASGTVSADVTNVAVACAVDTATASTLATAAAFNAVQAGDGAKLVGVAVDGSGNVYASDNNAGDIYVLAGGTAAPSMIYTTAGGAGLMAFGAKNSTLYEADALDQAIVAYDTQTSGPGTYLIDNATNGLVTPTGVAVDASGNLYVVDTGTSPATVTEYASSGTKLATLASGSATFAPYGVAVDANGNVYVTDQTHNAVFKLVSGSPVLLAGSGTAADTDGTGSQAAFNAPGGIVADASGNLYVVDTGSGAVRQITSAGVVTTLDTVTGATSIAVDASDNLYLTTQGASAGVIKLVPTAQ